MRFAANTPNRSGWFLAGLACVALKLWLVAAQPVVAVGPAGHDDRLYLELANHILRGEWLGPYSQFTLMKGPMYPLWIVATLLLGVPLPLSQHLLYLAGCILVVRALQPHVGSGWRSFLLFAVLWWNPMTYELPVLGRAIRQNLYTPTTLLFFAALIALETRRSAAWRTRLRWGLLLGVSGAVLWLTREETIWTAPSALLLAGAAAWASWRAGDKLRSLVGPLGVAAASAALIVGGVCTLNYRYYGWFGTVEFRAPQFIAAFGALQRVIPTHELPYVPVTREAREMLYPVSPAFAELKPYLEGRIGVNWAGASSPLTGRPKEEREIAGGWFMWALRDAVIAAGYSRDAAGALAFYARVAAEVNAACDEARLPAGPRRDTMVPRWHHGHWTRLVRTLPGYASYFATFEGFSAHPAPSTGSASTLRLFNDLVRWPLAPSADAPELDRPQQQRIDAWRIAVLDTVGGLLCRLDACLVALGLAGWFCLAVVRVRQRRFDYLFLVGTALLGACAAVVAINFLVHLLSFSNQGPGAFAQAYPLILVFAAIVVIDLIGTRPSRLPDSAP
jgi:hypothetical protein